MSELAKIVLIESVRHHEKADRLDVVTVDGYPAIVQRGLFAVGDKAIFIYPDSILPDAVWAMNYGGANARVKAKKIREVWSFGIAMPVNPMVAEYPVGTDLTEVLGLTKSEESDNQTILPYAVPRTKQSFSQEVAHLHYGKVVDVTQKVDGKSITVGYRRENDDFFVVGRRGNEVGADVMALIDAMELRYHLTAFCKSVGYDLALRFELYGEGIQSSKVNPHSKLPVALALFDVWNISKAMCEGTDSELYFVNVARSLKLETVRVIEHDVFLTEELVSQYQNIDGIDGKMFEGVVIKGEDFSFKIMNLYYDSNK